MVTLAALLALAAPGPAPAAASAPNAVIDAVDGCRKIANDAERLACFDRTAAAMADARARRELIVMDKAQVRKTRSSLFGFTIPSFKLFGGTDKDDAAEEIKQIDGKIAGSAPYGYNQFTITLADGSVWQTIEESSGFEPKRGEPIMIKRTALGFMAKVDNRYARIRRIR